MEIWNPMSSPAKDPGSRPASRLGLRCGDWVEVRSPKEVLATLDAEGRTDALPFMPEMQQFCGRRFKVSKRAEKACDTIHKTGARRMLDAVHLEDLRCDGDAHGGCQAGCRLFWKEAWLKRAPDPQDPSRPAPQAAAAAGGEIEATLRRASRRPHDSSAPNEEVYRCQATEMFTATLPMRPGDLWQYWRDLKCGNVTVAQILQAAFRAGANVLLSRFDRSFYPSVAGSVRGKTPQATACLLPGEVVEVKTKEEILATLNEQGRNRGLRFDAEMIPYCGGRHKVLRRVEQIIDERTGRMRRMPADCIVLEGVTCVGHLSSRRIFCQRAIYPYWREIWLRRVEQ